MEEREVGEGQVDDRPAIQFEEDAEVVFEDEPVAPSAPAIDLSALQGDLASVKETLGKQPDMTQAFLAAIDKVANKPIQVAPQVQVQTPVDPRARQKEDDEEFFRSPTQMVDKVLTAKFSPLIQQIAGALRGQSKELLLLSPDKAIYDRYKDEVEAEVQRLPPTSPTAYREAAQIVKARHLDEFMNERIQAEVAAALAAAGVTKDKATPSKPVAEIGGGAAPVRATYRLPKSVEPYYRRLIASGTPEDIAKEMAQEMAQGKR